MAEIHTIPELDEKGLRKFALTMSVMICLLFGLLIPYLFSYSLPRWPWFAAVVLALWGGSLPITFKPVYKVWMSFGLLMSKITTPLILGIMFYIILTPVSLIMCIIKKDPMTRELDANVKTYRVLRDETMNTDFERPF